MEMSLPEISAKFYELLHPLEPEARKRVVSSAFMLLGDDGFENSRIISNTVTPTVTPVACSGIQTTTSDSALELFGPKANRWIKQNGLSTELIEDIFHIENGIVQLIANDVPGDSSRAKTRSCYLLMGVKGLLENDEASFQDTDAVGLCQQMGCYDSGNNANTRKTLNLAGNKKGGFVLSAPSLREAAEVIKAMVKLD